MPTRPYTDITNAVTSSTTIRNGLAVVSCSKTGRRSVLDTYEHNTPVISDIDDKYGDKFYNGVFVITPVVPAP
jgi:hypothetical protein